MSFASFVTCDAGNAGDDVNGVGVQPTSSMFPGARLSTRHTAMHLPPERKHRTSLSWNSIPSRATSLNRSVVLPLLRFKNLHIQLLFKCIRPNLNNESRLVKKVRNLGHQAIPDAYYIG